MAMESLDQSIRLRMVGGRGLMLDAQDPVQFFPQCPGELGTAIRDNVVWHSKLGDPGPDEGLGDGLRHGVPERDRLRPPGITVHDGEKVAVVFGGRESSHEVYVKATELSVRSGEVLDRCPGVLRGLGTLAGVALAAP